MKKGAIETEKLVILVICLVVLAVVIFGFVRMWGGGEDTVDDIMDIDVNEPLVDEDGRFNPFGIMLLIPKTLVIKKLWR